MRVWKFWQFLMIACMFYGSSIANVVGQSNLVSREQANQAPKAVHPQPVALVVKQHGKTLRKVPQAGLVRHPPKLTQMVEEMLDRSDVSGRPDFLYSQSQFQTFADGSAEILTQGGMLIRMGSESLIRFIGAAYRETDGMLGWRVLFGPGDYILTGITRRNEQEVMNGPLNGGFACIKKDKRQQITKLPPHDYPITVANPDQALMIECRAKVSERFLLPSPVPKAKEKLKSPPVAQPVSRPVPAKSKSRLVSTANNQKQSLSNPQKKQKTSPVSRKADLSRPALSQGQAITGGKSKAGYYLQVGAFRERKYAITRQKKLRDIGQKNVSLSQIAGWYKIQIGPFARRQLAEKEGAQIRQKLGFRSFVKKK